MTLFMPTSWQVGVVTQMLLSTASFWVKYKYLLVIVHDWSLEFNVLFVSDYLTYLHILNVNVKWREEHNQIGLAKWMTKSKLCTYCFRPAMASTESW